MTDIAISGPMRRNADRAASSGSAADRSLSAEILGGTHVYQELREHWMRLAEVQPGAILFQTPDLLAAWSHHFVDGPGTFAATVVVSRSGRPVLIWPLFVEQRSFIRIARGAGAPIGQYDDALLDPACDARELMAIATEALRRATRPDLVLLERVRADSTLRAMLGDLPPLAWPEAAPYSDTSGGTAALMASLKSRVARQQRKRVRQLEETGRVGFAVAHNADEARRWLREAISLKRDWLRSTGRLSRAFMRPQTGDCLADLASALAAPNAAPRIIVSRLSLDERTAAIEMGFTHRGAYHLYLGAFAPELGKFGPGNILTERVLDWCAANGIARYDMLAPRSRNKSEWQSGEVLVADYAIPTTLAGRAYVSAYLQRLEPALRSGFYALPAPVRSAIAGGTLRNLKNEAAK